jgi:Flp pilus assembly protein TadB
MRNTIYYICQIFLFFSVTFLSFVLADRALNRQYFRKISDNIRLLNEEYSNGVVRRRENHKKLRIKKTRNLIYWLTVLIERTGIRANSFLWFVNAPLILFICFCSSLLVYFAFNYFFKVISVSIIMCGPGFLLPLIFLESAAQRKEDAIEKVLGIYLLQLKNNTKIHNDIIEAFRSVQNNCIEPLRTFTKQFLVEISSGISVEIALENFKDKVNINRFKLFLTNVQYCYNFGGNFTELLDKTYQLISEIEKEKKNRVQETRSARWVLFILIGLDLFLYFNFIDAQPEYMNIMRATFFGQLILNSNFLSVCFLLWLSYSVKKLDY